MKTTTRSYYLDERSHQIISAAKPLAAQQLMKDPSKISDSESMRFVLYSFAALKKLQIDADPAQQKN